MSKVTGTTEDPPNWPLHTTKKTNKAAAGKVKEAVLKLKPGTAHTDRVVEGAGLEGFIATADKDFDLMRDAARAAGVF